MKQTYLFLIFVSMSLNISAQKRLRDYGVKIGVMKTGALNAITDVKGVKVGHTTIQQGDSINTGVTAIIPAEGNLFQSKVPAAIYIGNGFGKLMGISQVKELGNLETPIVLTNTLSIATAADAIIDYSVSQKENQNLRSVNAIVGETNDSYLNDIVGRHVKKQHILTAIENAKNGVVAEGNVGAGTGTVCFGFKGGIGTASRVLPKASGGYTVGVLVQTNFGGVLQIDGVPVGVALNQYFLNSQLNDPADGSCMIVVITDAPVTARNLERIAKRAMMGLAKTGGIASNGSGDYVIAISNAEGLRVPHESKEKLQTVQELRNDEVSPLFLATIEATEEAILNSLFAAKTLKGKNGTIQSLPIDQTIKLLKEYKKIN
ncbi:P1 family peptidase [Flectobacillus sp. BAB-3569]|uniref:DmpA family aminopeptidase n=1 Tax=Flectobacillus sp. BAB-3569 TaxID=1509483 RepID=UPI000BA42B2F|nr:P1 family peptidase [Flectobacillus sp. BAB-3569]PAC32442.1 aminopeptidase [Flectobacillus sp. BAB-3569]